MNSATSQPGDWGWEDHPKSFSRKKNTQHPPESGAELQKRSGATTGGSLEQPPVVVWEAANQLEAQIVKGRLESEGIPAVIKGEALAAIYGLTLGGLAATDVLVPGLLAEKALNILSSAVDWTDLDWTDGAIADHVEDDAIEDDAIENDAIENDDEWRGQV